MCSQKLMHECQINKAQKLMQVSSRAREIKHECYASELESQRNKARMPKWCKKLPKSCTNAAKVMHECQYVDRSPEVLTEVQSLRPKSKQTGAKPKRKQSQKKNYKFPEDTQDRKQSFVIMWKLQLSVIGYG